MRNVFYLSVASFALGMISASDTFPKNMIIALCVLYSAFLVYKTAYSRKFKYGIAVVFLAVGFMSYSGIYNYKISGVKDFCDKNCDVYATVLSSDYGTNSVKYTAKLTKINSENKNLKIMFYAPKGTKFYRGDEVVLRGVTPEIPKNMKNFDYNSYLKAKGVFLTVFAPREKIEVTKEGRGFLRFFGILRDRIIENNNKNLDGELAGVVNAITTGDKSGLSGNIKRAFSTSGVSHLLAISGLHLTILVSLIGAFLNDEFYIVKRFVKPIFSIVTTSFIMLITGMGYSVMRAGIMLLIMNFSLLSGRGRNSINSLMIAGTVIIFLNPYAVFDVGFELSFFATLGIVLFSTKICGFLVRFLRIKWLCGSIAVTVSAQVFTLPLIVLYYGNIGIYSIVANIVIVPVFTILLLVSMIFCLVSLMPLPGFVTMLFTGNIFVYEKLSYIIARFISRLPFASIPVTGFSFAIMLIFAVSLYGLYKIYKNGMYKPVCVALSAVCLAGIFYVNYDGRDLRVNFVDVGQGACSHIKTPGGENILIDCGVSKYYSNDDIARSTVEPYFNKNGVTHIDYAILSHYHDDHFSGLISLMNDGLIDCIVLPRNRSADDEEDYQNIRNTAIMNDVDIKYFSRGNEIYPDGENGGVKIYAISPFVTDDWKQNSESLVLKLTYKGKGFLFTGDIENDVMKTLKSDEITADVIQSPHHGSKSSDDNNFYRNTQADCSVISVGKGNSYNHPHKEHLGALKENGIRIFRTDECGTVYFKVDRKGNIKYKVTEGIYDEAV